MQVNWADGLVWLGRLPFNVEKMPIDVPGKAKGEPAWWIHIPASGSLSDAWIHIPASGSLSDAW